MSHSRPHRGNGAGPHRGIPLDQCRWIDSSANASNRVRGAPEVPYRRGAGPGFRPWRGRGGPARQYGTRRFRLPVPVIPTRPRPPTPEIDPENGRVDVNDFDLSIITSPEPGDAKSITDFPQGTSRSSTLGIGLSSGLTSKDPAWPRIQVDGMVPRAKMRKADILKTPSEASRIGDARTSSPMDHHRFTPPQSSVCVASPRSVISSEKAPASSHPYNVGNSDQRLL
ncbi:uncharacterized protein EI90DRAFT_703168 [Cantharellus anzutake]|uniref:uncharacterized protein n=1 Tax=Cantharellus anzutake TaxID=1750568 RepID=UPI0019082C73|nr:uncharacterized protein EI90DRAFT_703168 [Cantharellus anzutake]KAF8332773.1 hypothetical protein EI90DRAFT_703168 [Cantharellus anzutake]